MKEYRSVGTICVKDEFNLVYKVCKIEYILYDDDKFKFVFTPNYSVIHLLHTNLFQGIPGLNLDLNKEEYIRDNMNPVFISERVPSKNREDYYELLAELNMEYMDPIKYLILTDKKYSGDNLFVEAYEEKRLINIDETTLNNDLLIGKVLKNICLGNDILFNGTRIDDSNRESFYNIFIILYKKCCESKKNIIQEGINNAKKEGKYKGRKPIQVDMDLFNDRLERVERKELTRQQVMNELGISKDKYYRLKNISQK
jgi:hypothetical protein